MSLNPQAKFFIGVRHNAAGCPYPDEDIDVEEIEKKYDVEVAFTGSEMDCHWIVTAKGLFFDVDCNDLDCVSIPPLIATAKQKSQIVMAACELKMQGQFGAYLAAYWS